MYIGQYRCHKEVRAFKIAKIHPVFVDNDVTLVDGASIYDDCNESVYVDRKWLRKHTPKVGGYYVIYEDGYSSYSPKEAFENGYTRIDK